MSRLRLGIVVTHPIQYQVPLFRYLAERSSLEPLVFFLSEHGLSQSFDSGFGQAVKYDVPLLGGYEYRIVRNHSPKPSVSTAVGVFNPSLPRLIRNSGVDVLLVHGYNNISHWLAYATAACSKVPYLLRGDSQPDKLGVHFTKSLAKRAVIRPLVRNAGACLAIGQYNAQFYRSYGARPDQIFFAPYSVDTEYFATAGESGRTRRTSALESIGLEPGIPLVLLVAKLQPWKRPMDVVLAMDQLQRSANLIVIGDGPLRPEMEHLASVRPWMRVLGFVNQTKIAEWYGVADLIVLPSSSEKWGLVVNEAMAAGAVPIVSNAVGCAPDLVTPDVGWVHTTGDIKALASAMADACHPGALIRRREAARQRAADYGIAATAHGFENAVTAVLDR